MPFKNEERIFPRDYENRIFCEDCLTFMKGIPDGSVPLILTDPPYGIHYSNQFAKNPHTVPFPVSWTVKMKKKQKETQDILSYHTQAAGCSDKARAKASGGRQPIEECGRTGL